MSRVEDARLHLNLCHLRLRYTNLQSFGDLPSKRINTRTASSVICENLAGAGILLAGGSR
jgi:hypothetical protein